MSIRVLLLLFAFHASSASAFEPDPLQSVMWEYHHKGLLNSEPYVFDERIQVHVPPFAEDSRQVPVHIDARALGDEVVRIEAWADLNPIPRIFTFTPGEQVVPLVAIRIRVQQATPIRAAVLTRDGVWHIGSARVEAAGGGCTAPSVVRAQAGWEDHLGEVVGARFPRGEFSRLRLQISHPMDNGLVGGIPEFFLNQAELRDADGKVMAELELYPAVAENPNLSLEVKGGQETHLWLRDNNGNEFEAAF
ncbi:quinoprotein dehydrogenase-associated SoxYZ-like carrier [Pseudomonas stutzeri]|uniref:Quinoprotein dehydrogenase-associated SoxYZ-like carrier n=1 Tax=Stutzerimonas stutzeri TaxID=316 RepID=A0A2N8S0Q9_STUST|nr:quinoprotein dehydrogenase-associated SoxYZ-like carrier [Stutzerimonas stutzeri]MCQ4297325.1 quinoprotein dehydrogenase-associated SoxYZ-like carrier [Stutzerimonas stutzeri]PNF80191.1 quinoprotein dehydrogenase-associated SoxYZ-like carrier [Stutzerimonas stutzeri]